MEHSITKCVVVARLHPALKTWSSSLTSDSDLTIRSFAIGQAASRKIQPLSRLTALPHAILPARPAAGGIRLLARAALRVRRAVRCSGERGTQGAETNLHSDTHCFGPSHARPQHAFILPEDLRPCKLVGSGAWGVVLCCTTGGGAMVAVKKIQSDTGHALQRSLREVRAAGLGAWRALHRLRWAHRRCGRCCSCASCGTPTSSARRTSTCPQTFPQRRMRAARRPRRQPLVLTTFSFACLTIPLIWPGSSTPARKC